MIGQGCDRNGEGRDGCGRPHCGKCYSYEAVKCGLCGADLSADPLAALARAALRGSVPVFCEKCRVGGSK